MENRSDLCRSAVIGDLKLFRGILLMRAPSIHPPAAHGEMQVLTAFTGVAARFGVASRAHHRDSQGQDCVSQSRRLTRAEDDADLRKT